MNAPVTNASFMTSILPIVQGMAERYGRHVSQLWRPATVASILRISLVVSPCYCPHRVGSVGTSVGIAKCYPERGAAPKLCKFGFLVVSRWSGAASSGLSRHQG